MANQLSSFNPQNATAYDPGEISIMFDDRHSGPPAGQDQTSYAQSIWLSTMQRIGRPSWHVPDLEPGYVRVIWYTYAGVEGSKDYRLWQANDAKEAFDSLSHNGLRPMILGWSAENPFPMIGGSEPPSEPKKPTMKVAKSASGYYSGHGGDAKTTPHERIMKIIEYDEEREAKAREEQVRISEKAEKIGYGSSAV